MSDIFTAQNVLVLAGTIYSVCLHEAAHAVASDNLGDDTPRRLGKLTFNPIPHIRTSPFFTLILPLISFVYYGGQGAIGAGACPVNPDRLRNPRADEFWVAAAGPSMNVLLCMVFSLLFSVHVGPVTDEVMIRLALLNLWLAVFNLIPIPPMDGSVMLTALIPALRSPFRAVGMQAGFLLVYVVGGAIMQEVSGPLMAGYRLVLRQFGAL